MSIAETAAPEFSRLISIEGITPDRKREETVEATAPECDALAKRFELRGLSSLKAKIAIRRVAGGTTIRLEGRVEADVVQACVVSLQDVPAHVDTTFETFFTDKAPEEKEGEIDLALDDEDSAPEMVVNGFIDLGEVAAQYLFLALDPYPRAPGVSLAAQLAEVGGLGGKPNPFQVLEGLKDKGKKE